MQQISLKVQQPSICLLFSGAHLRLEKMLSLHYCRHRVLRHVEACSCIQWHVIDIPIKIQVIIFCLPIWITVFYMLLNWKLNLCHFQLYYLLSILPSHQPNTHTVNSTLHWSHMIPRKKCKPSQLFQQNSTSSENIVYIH